MIVSFFSRGIGAGKGPVHYCIDQVVPVFDPVTRKKIKGKFKIRDPVPVILRGDPKLTISLIDSIDNKWKYTSGVIAFAVSDAPSIEIQSQVIDDFEKTNFAGLEPDGYNTLWIRHEHEGNVELHFVIPRVELVTGKALNIAPPGYSQMMDSWRDKWNYQEGWASPDEPDRKKLFKRDSINFKMDSEALRQGLPLPDDPKRLIGEFLVQRIEAGSLNNREDVLSALKDAGLEINRIGKDYISVRPEPGAKPIRLKGLLYESNFEIRCDRVAALLRDEFGIAGGAAESKDAGGSWRNPEDDRKRVAVATAKLAKFIDARSRYNSERYRKPAVADLAIVDELQQRDAERHERDQSAISPVSDVDQPESPGAAESSKRVADSGERADPDPGPGDQSDTGRGRESRENEDAGESEIDRLAANRVENRDGEADEAASPSDEATAYFDSSDSPLSLPWSLCVDLGLPADRSVFRENDGHDIRQSELSVDHRSGLDELRIAPRVQVPLQKDKLTEIFDKLNGYYDGIRNSVTEIVGRAWSKIQVGWREFGKASEQLITTSEQLVTATDFAVSAVSAVTASNQQLVSIVAESERCNSELAKNDLGIRRIKANRLDELEQFKREINLVEYAESQGYEINFRESRRASTVMRHQAGDKIIVATDQDGHGIYFSVRDGADSGSIIDFVQRRQGLNLGQVRKELRPWAGTRRTAQPVRKPVADRPAKPEASSRDRQQVLRVWMHMHPQPQGGHPYLLSRGLSAETLEDPRFVNMVRSDGRGNAVFPHFDRGGITGYELKNDGFTGFAKDGEKSLWYSSNIMTAKRVVICESAIDCMSHAQCTGDTDTAYLSVGGQPSVEQWRLIERAVTKVQERGDQVVLATDADEVGDNLARIIGGLAPGALRARPEAKDWNEQLVAQQQLSSDAEDFFDEDS